MSKYIADQYEFLFIVDITTNKKESQQENSLEDDLYECFNWWSIFRKTIEVDKTDKLKN